MKSYDKLLLANQEKFPIDHWRCRRLEEERERLRYFAETLTVQEIELIVELRKCFYGTTHHFWVAARNIAEANTNLKLTEESKADEVPTFK